MCPVRALAYHLAHRFTLDGHLFPDPADQETWLSAAMFPGRTDPTNNVTYETQAQELRQLFLELGLDFSKLTHIFRVGGARHLDAAGVDDSVSAAPSRHAFSCPRQLCCRLFVAADTIAAVGRWPAQQHLRYGWCPVAADCALVSTAVG